jgi:EAL domain-containing protein (putative c-di-GMP-specific phosphodiesterase class I)
MEVVAYLQPIISVRERGVRLVEALARGILPDGRVRPPAELLAEAALRGYEVDFAQQARHAAFTAYSRILGQPRVPLLSLNTDTSLVLDGARGADTLAAEVLKAGLSPSNIVLEILESAFSEVSHLEDFCRAVRRFGFLIALDDVGTGYSNLERIPRLEPDILKIDRVLVHGMSGNYHRREVFRSLVLLSHQIGALAIAEGVEQESDVIAGLGLGCDLFQGFYFGRPADVRYDVPLVDEARMQEAGDRFRVLARRRLNDRRVRQRNSEQSMRTLVAELKGLHAQDFDALLRVALARMSFVEALYVLDERGVQVVDTVTRGGSSREALFRPAVAGTDQSLKHYFLMLHAGLERFTSDPYISSSSGNFCITMSRHFTTGTGHAYVLCCDLVVSREET